MAVFGPGGSLGCEDLCSGEDLCCEDLCCEDLSFSRAGVRLSAAMIPDPVPLRYLGLLLSTISLPPPAPSLHPGRAVQAR